MRLHEYVSSKVEQYVSSHESFEQTVNKHFAEFDTDRTGKISLGDAVTCFETIFDNIEKELRRSGIRCRRPSKEEITEILGELEKIENSTLTQTEFLDFYEQVIKYSCVKRKRGLFFKFWRSGFFGFLGVISLKIGSVLISDWSEIPYEVMLYFPAVIVGPILGCTIQRYISKKELRGLKKDLFDKNRVKEKKPEVDA